MSISSALANIATKMVGFGINLTKSLFGQDTSSYVPPGRPPKLKKESEIDQKSPTQMLGGIFELMQKKEQENKKEKAEQESLDKRKYQREIERTDALIKALSIKRKTVKKQVKEKKVSKEEKPAPTEPTPTPSAPTKPTPTPTPTAPSAPPTPPAKAPTPTPVKPTTPAPSATKIPSPTVIAGTTVAVAAGAAAITKIIEVGKGYNVVQLSSGEIVKREGAWNWRNNNPGNIEYGEYALSKGAIPYSHGGNKPKKQEERFAVFPTYEIGRQAKADLIFEGKNYRDLNLDDAITRYAPPSENNTAAYQIAVKGVLNIPQEKLQTMKMKDFNKQQRNLILSAMEKQEGYGSGKKQTSVIQKASENVPTNMVSEKIDNSTKENIELKDTLKQKQTPIVTNTNLITPEETLEQENVPDKVVDDRNIYLKKSKR